MAVCTPSPEAVREMSSSILVVEGGCFRARVNGEHVVTREWASRMNPTLDNDRNDASL